MHDGELAFSAGGVRAYVNNKYTSSSSSSFLTVRCVYAGFTTAHTSCCNVDTEVGGLCLPNTRPCSDRSAFVFWDAYHTSDAANKVIADRLWADMMSAAGQGGGASAPPRVGASSPAAAPSPSPSQDDY